jgi:hypothetical protein
MALRRDTIYPCNHASRGQIRKLRQHNETRQTQLTSKETAKGWEADGVG